MDIAARAPNHLGDGVMSLPAMHALAALGRLTIWGPRWAAELYRDVPADIRSRKEQLEGDVAVLFPPSLSSAWLARRVPVRIGIASDYRRWLLNRVVRPCRHRVDTYNALARAAGATPVGVPTYTLRESDTACDVPEHHVGLNPLSASGERRHWTGFSELAQSLSVPTIGYCGPGEALALQRVLPNTPQRAALSLPAFAKSLSHCAVFVSVDTGPAHFARACGVPTIVIHTSTDPSHTCPLGAQAVIALGNAGVPVTAVQRLVNAYV